MKYHYLYLDFYNERGIRENSFCTSFIVPFDMDGEQRAYRNAANRKQKVLSEHRGWTAKQYIGD